MPPHDDSTPGVLDEQVKAGDERALAAAFEQHRSRLWRMVHFRLDPRLRGRLDADDVLQDVFLNAAQRIDHFATSQPMSLFVWLRLIAGQTLIDLHRRHLGAQRRDAGRERTLSQQMSDNTSQCLSFHLLAQLTSPSGVAVRAEQSQAVEAALQDMSEMDREVLALRHFEELANREVAEVLGIETKAASIRYMRALGRLKQSLGDVPGFFSEPDVRP